MDAAKKQALNILMINYEYPPIGGGGGVLCRDIAEGLVSLGHAVSVVTSRYEGSRKHEVINGVHVYRVPVLFRKNQNVASLLSMLSYVPMAILQGRRVLKERSFDVINTYFAVPSGPAGNYLSRAFGIPNVLCILGGDIYDPSKLLSPHKTPGVRATVEKMLRSADRVISESTDIKEKVSRYYSVKREIGIIPLGVRPNSYGIVGRRELGLPGDKQLLITVGRLIRRKNLKELVSIFGELVKDMPSQLLIVGEGPELDHLTEQIKGLGLEDNIKLLGRITDEQKYQYLSVSDIYVSTALHEGFGIVFLEAMECGLPVVCYDKGGQTDFLKNGVTGYIVELGNTSVFLSRVVSLMHDEKLRERISGLNKGYVKEFYAEKCAEKYEQLFYGVVLRHTLIKTNHTDLFEVR